RRRDRPCRRARPAAGRDRAARRLHRPGLAARRPAPVVDVRLLRLRSLGSASAVLSTAGAAIYAGMFLLPLYYQPVHGETVLLAGLLLIPQGVGSLAARFTAGTPVARLGAPLGTVPS